MHIITKNRLQTFWAIHPRAEAPLRAWYSEAKAASWGCFADIKKLYGSADVVAGNRVIFEIGGDKFRLIVKFDYPKQVGFIKFVGTHAEYDRINAKEVE